jgi:hypothetical protein
MKKTRVARPKGELERELQDQVAILQGDCTAFDRGMEAIGKRIALSLRVLLYHHGGSQALLEQLNLRNDYFFDTAGALDPKNLIPECNLISLQIREAGGHYVPPFTAGSYPRRPRLLHFSEWWGRPVLKDAKGQKFCRRELVSHVADTDGGAHVDPKLDEAYMDLSRNNSLGWTFSKDGGAPEPLQGKPELVCMRQIAEEVLMTLRRRYPKAFSSNLPRSP